MTAEQRLSQRIEADKAEPQHRYEVHDPRIDAAWRLPTASAAIARAEQQEMSGFQVRATDGSLVQVSRGDRGWALADGTPLAEHQRGNDAYALREIQERAALRRDIGAEFPLDRQLAELDAHAFRRIDDEATQRLAAQTIHATAERFPGYKAGLDRAIPGYPGTAERIYARAVEPSQASGPQQPEQERAAEKPRPPAVPAVFRELRTNRLEADEIGPVPSPVRPVIPEEIERKYLRVGDRYFYPGRADQVAFEDKGNKLETRSSSEAIADSLVRIAEARGWNEIKVSGTDRFRREVWLEAAARGMQVKGFNPTELDKAALTQRMERGRPHFRGRENHASKPEPERKAAARSFAEDSPQEAVRKHPQLAGAAAAEAAIEKKVEADRLAPDQRAIVMARVRQNIVNSIERGTPPEIRIADEHERIATRDRELGR